MFKFTSPAVAEGVARHCGGRACAVASIHGELTEVDDSIPADFWAIKVNGDWFDMTQQVWERLTSLEQSQARDLSQLNRQLLGLEGRRVEVTTEGGSRYRFQVGRSSGWIPCHLSLHNSRSMGGSPIRRDMVYASVRDLGIKRRRSWY